MLIGGDWGTSNLRLFRFDAEGRVVEQRERPLGVMRFENGAFEAVLQDLAGDWLAQGGPVVLSGMVGSRMGWIEAPYLSCPAGPGEIAAALVRAPSVLPNIHIVPGLSDGPAQAPTDVMRGEETEIYGAVSDDDGKADGLVLSPGTHSKWARLVGGRIAGFTTYMTGEVYGLLREHSVLGRLIEGEAADPEAFRLGVARAATEPDLLSLLFSVRITGLFGVVQPSGVASYLSGVLIGAEVAAGLRRAETRAVTVISNPTVAALYVEAFAHHGVDAVTVIDNATAASRGLWRLACAAPDLMRTA